MKYIDGEIYLSPSEAGAVIGVSYKTIQRWVESGKLHYWAKVNGKRQKIMRAVDIHMHYSVTGYRLYKQSDIQDLKRSLDAAAVESELKGE